MTRKDIAQSVSEKTGLSKRDAEAAVVAVFATIKEALLSGETLTIRGFGTFSLRYQRARKGRIIRSGEMIVIPPRLRVHFDPSDNFQAAVTAKKELLERFTSK